MWPFAPDPLAWSSGEILVAVSLATTLIAISIAALMDRREEQRPLGPETLEQESERLCAEVDELLDEAGHDA